jgi:hypothetical protein
LSTVSTNRRLFNFSEWLDAFIIYMGIRSAAHPQESVPLVKYLQTVKRIQGRGGNFVKYDEGFRCKHRGAATIPWQELDIEEFSWSLGDPGYVPYEQFRKRQQQQRAAPSQPFGQYAARAPLWGGRRHCYAYNGGTRCVTSPCIYAHVCSKCRGDHPWSACRDKAPAPARKP